MVLNEPLSVPAATVGALHHSTAAATEAKYIFISEKRPLILSHTGFAVAAIKSSGWDPAVDNRTPSLARLTTSPPARANQRKAGCAPLHVPVCSADPSTRRLRD